MAQTVKTQPVSKPPVIEDEGKQALEHLQGFYEKNKKVIGTVVTAIVVLTVAIVGYFYFYKAPRETKAAGKVFYAQQYFMTDSLDKALNGDGAHPGFLKVIRDYGGTKTANLSHYYAGICFLKQGNPKQAIKQLEDFDGEGTLVGTAAYAALGDAYMETGNANKAIDNYKKATEDEDNTVQTLMYLMHLGAAYEQNKQPEEAIKVYRKVRDNYPNSMPARDIDRFLARLGYIED